MAMGPTVSLAFAASKLVVGHAQRIWRNLTAEERKEFFELITPSEGSPYQRRTVQVPRTPVKISRKPGKLFPTIEKADFETAEREIPVPDVNYLKLLSDEDRKRLWYLIKKANMGRG